MSSDRPTPDAPVMWLAEFIRTHKDAILADWTAAVRTIPVARELPRLLLLDHIPALLDHIADLSEADDGVSRPSVPVAPSHAHALERLGEGYDLGEVVTEYAVLRECLLRQWETHGVQASHPSELRILNRAIDYAISVCVARFTSARDRTLRALDRISAAALGTDKLETFLPALLLVLKETTPTIDWVTLLLREGDLLVARASVGLEEAAARLETVRVGEGFAGLVAQGATPLLSHAGADDPRVTSAAIRGSGTRALFGVPLLHNGEVIGVAEAGSRLATDFSDEDKMLLGIMATRATAMLEQHRLRELAERRAADAQRATDARDEMLAIVSHDLRNPLSAILAAASLLGRAGASDDVRRKSAIIERAAHRMSLLLEDLLDVSRIDAGALTLERAPIDAAAVVQEAIEQQRGLAEERAQTLVAEVADGLPRVSGDRERVLRVFANLLSNAIKFTPRAGRIVVRAARDGAAVRFAVEDSGPGVAPEQLPHLFDRYWQGRADTRQGAGLGLAIVKGIVETHGGRAWAESRPGAGSTFFFTLPLDG